MKQEDKKLLLKDLCSRLLYGIKVGTTDNDGSLKNVWNVLWYNTFTEDVKLIHSVEDATKLDDICEVKPYLFPLSSMSYKQFKSIERYLKHCEYQYIHSADTFKFISIKTYKCLIQKSSKSYDLLHKHKKVLNFKKNKNFKRIRGINLGI